MKNRVKFNPAIVYAVGMVLAKLVPKLGNYIYDSHGFMKLWYAWVPFSGPMTDHWFTLLLMNALLALPFGMLVEYFCVGRAKWTLALLPLAVELLQPMVRLGIFDMTTVLFSYAGFFVGMAICMLGKSHLAKVQPLPRF